MRWLLLISRIGFLCNICYAFSVIARYINLKSLNQISFKNIDLMIIQKSILSIFFTLFDTFKYEYQIPKKTEDFINSKKPSKSMTSFASDGCPAADC